MATPLPLEGDGLIDNLFHFLWSKDDFGAGPRIYVPHTVVFKATQPSAWYFTSLKTGKIKKKNKVNLTNLQIEHEFTKHSKQQQGGGAPSDIVACYLYQLPTSSSSNSSHLGSDDDDGSGSPSTVIEHFDAAALHDFLFMREKPHNGILQRFVLPKGTHNATIRAIWSPKICLLERRVNTKSLYDPRFTVYERGVTFDGGGAGELFSRPEPVRGAMLPGEVQLLCEQLVDHVTQVSYHKYRISRMVLQLKSDADDRLWLLWCSSLRLLKLHASASGGAIPRPLDIVSDAQMPAHISLGKVGHVANSPQQQQLKTSKSTGKLRQQPSVDDRETPLRDGFQRCTSCASVTEQSRMLTTNYKAVLEHFQKFLVFLRLQVNEQERVAIEWPPEQRLIDAAGGVGFGITPFCERINGAGAVMQAATNKTKKVTSHHLAGLNAKELIIPPVIKFLHPTLSVEEFERHRHDPIFLHKPVAVCETCCLVYSDYATTALEANSIRANGPAILRPQREVNELKRRLDPIDTISIAASPVKPLASAWKPIPKNVEKAAKLSMSASGSGLTKATLHSLPPAPRLPDRIESLAEFMGRISTDSDDTSGSTPLHGSASASAILQQREELFFRELYHQQGADVGEGHPLQHMLESSGKMAQVASVKKKQLAAIHKGSTEQGSDGDGWQGLGTSSSMSALDQILKKQPSTKNPYTIIQKLNGRDQGKQQRRKQQKQSQKASRARESEPTSDGEEHRLSPAKAKEGGQTKANNNTSDMATRRKFISSREALACESHQEFLFAALRDAQQQLDQMESLMSLVLPSPSPAAADKHGSMVQAPTMDELHELLSENASLPPDQHGYDAFQDIEEPDDLVTL